MTAVDASKYPDWAFEQTGTTKFVWQILPIVLLFFCGIAGGIMGLVWYTSKRSVVESAARAGALPPYGYGAPPPGYGAPPPGYGAPPPGWGAPPAAGWVPPSAPPRSAAPPFPPPPSAPPPYPPPEPPPEPSQ
jgi:hypothetical protein